MSPTSAGPLGIVLQPVRALQVLLWSPRLNASLNWTHEYVPLGAEGNKLQMLIWLTAGGRTKVQAKGKFELWANRNQWTVT